jgi:hypothetical protein
MRWCAKVLVTMLLLAGVAAGFDASGVAAQATPEPSVDNWLFTLNFRSADLAVTDETTGQGTLALHGVDTEVLAFTDHPQRQAAVVPVDAFVASVDGAEASPPNALLVIALSDADQAFEAVLVLDGASIDDTAGTVMFDVTLTYQEGTGTPVAVAASEHTLPAGYLFVDDLQVPVHVPVNVCGNTVNVIGLLNPAFGTTCVNAGGDETGG